MIDEGIAVALDLEDLFVALFFDRIDGIERVPFEKKLSCRRLAACGHDVGEIQRAAAPAVERAADVLPLIIMGLFIHDDAGRIALDAVEGLEHAAADIAAELGLRPARFL